ncbi:MAG: hypothetical protein PHC61_10750 [Chitinivibrionales bacterium]|nr:hypothetical protein [Chitinivibrionales bacterium]
MSYNADEHPSEDALIQATTEDACAPEVFAHCRECPACGRYLLEIRALRKRLESIDEEDIPAHLRSRILSHAPRQSLEEKTEFSVLKWYRNPLVWIAGIIGFAVFAYIFFVFVP